MFSNKGCILSMHLPVLVEFHQKLLVALLVSQLSNGCIGLSYTHRSYLETYSPLRITVFGVLFLKHVHFLVDHIFTKEIVEADELLLRFCCSIERHYGHEECTANMHMHCHLKDCILDMGPLFSFWCFSFEQYNILEQMNKTWNAPELQFIHKFANLQVLASHILPENTPL